MQKADSCKMQEWRLRMTASSILGQNQNVAAVQSSKRPSCFFVILGRARWLISGWSASQLSQARRPFERAFAGSKLIRLLSNREYTTNDRIHESFD